MWYSSNIMVTQDGKENGDAMPSPAAAPDVKDIAASVRVAG